MLRLQAGAAPVVHLQAPALEGGLLCALPLPGGHQRSEAGQPLAPLPHQRAPGSKGPCHRPPLCPSGHALQGLPAGGAARGVRLPEAQHAAQPPALHVLLHGFIQRRGVRLLLPPVRHQV